jgi:hypothetical protein
VKDSPIVARFSNQYLPASLTLQLACSWRDAGPCLFQAEMNVRFRRRSGSAFACNYDTHCLEQDHEILRYRPRHDVVRVDLDAAAIARIIAAREQVFENPSDIFIG